MSVHSEVAVRHGNPMGVGSHWLGGRGGDKTTWHQKGYGRYGVAGRSPKNRIELHRLAKSFKTGER